MHFDIAGPPTAPPLVLVHGSVVTRVIWRRQVSGLSDVYRVLAPDLPGHGSLAGEVFSFDAAVRRLADLIRVEAGGRALVVGLSLGGYVSMDLAARHPGLVSGLVLTGCSLNFQGIFGMYLKAVSALMRRGWLTQSRDAAAAKTRRLFPPALSDVADAQIAAGVHPEWLGPAFGEMAGRDFAGLLDRFGGPGLILNGARDTTMRRGAARFAARLHPGTVAVIPDAGHACNIDQPEAYNRAVRAFGDAIGWTAATGTRRNP